MKNKKTIFIFYFLSVKLVYVLFLSDPILPPPTKSVGLGGPPPVRECEEIVLYTMTYTAVCGRGW